MKLNDLITPMILTFNEAPNIARTLERMAWARQVLVIDSFSTDDTLSIIQSHPQVKLLQRPFDSFAAQCNFGLSHIETPWVLSLDADYVLSPQLIREIERCDLAGSANGYSAPFVYCVHGRPLRGTLYPPRTVLYRKDAARYEDDGHGHRVQVQGLTRRLSAPILHDDRKSFSRWLQSQDRYMILEAQKLLNTSRQKLSRTDRIRRHKVLAPALALVYCLFVKQLILDGWPGWHYTLQRVLAEVILAARLIEAEHLDTATFAARE